MANKYKGREGGSKYTAGRYLKIYKVYYLKADCETLGNQN
jgi:hypothetical protein